MVEVFAGRVERMAVRLALAEQPALEFVALVARHRVGVVIVVRPGDGRAGIDHDVRWREREVLQSDFGNADSRQALATT